MRSKREISNRKAVYLSLKSQIERQLRDAFSERYLEEKETKSSLSKKLGINRSLVTRRLRGETNMTTKTIADMVWALGQSIRVDIFDPNERALNEKVVVSQHNKSYEIRSLNSNTEQVSADNSISGSTRAGFQVKKLELS